MTTLDSNSEKLQPNWIETAVIFFGFRSGSAWAQLGLSLGSAWAQVGLSLGSGRAQVGLTEAAPQCEAVRLGGLLWYPLYRPPALPIPRGSAIPSNPPFGSREIVCVTPMSPADRSTWPRRLSSA
jgi:hypothetical protein